MVTFSCFFASPSSLFPSMRSFICAQLILACNRLSLDEMSGLVFDAAYCSDPINPRRLCFSFSLIVVSGVLRRSLSMCMASIWLIYSLWSK